MSNVLLTELRANLATYVDRATAGEVITITRRRGRGAPVPIARLVPLDVPPGAATITVTPSADGLEVHLSGTVRVGRPAVLAGPE